MLRATVLSIVVVLATGQDAAALLCAWWCHPGGATMAGCHERNDGGATAQVTADEDACANAVGAAVALVKEDARRSDPGAKCAVALPSHRQYAPHADARYEADRGHAPPRGSGPLLLALRI